MGRKDSQLQNIDPEDRQRLADLFYVKLHEELKKDYEMVKTPGPDTMHVQVAITESEGSNPVPDTVSSIVPQLRVLTGLKGFSTGVSGFTGSANVEMKAADSVDNTLLTAAVIDGVERKIFAGSRIGGMMSRKPSDIGPKRSDGEPACLKVERSV